MKIHENKIYAFLARLYESTGRAAHNSASVHDSVGVAQNVKV